MPRSLLSGQQTKQSESGMMVVEGALSMRPRKLKEVRYGHKHGVDIM